MLYFFSRFEEKKKRGTRSRDPTKWDHIKYNPPVVMVGQGEPVVMVGQGEPVQNV